MALPTVTNNSPSAGYISWTEFGIQYDGESFAVPAGNTNKRYTCWRYNGGSPTITASDDYPNDLNPEDIILFLNKNGIGLLAPTTTVLDGGLIVPGSILADAIAANQIDTFHINANAITANEIAAGAIGVDELAAGSVTASKLSIGSVSDSKVVNGSFEDGIEGWELSAGNGSAGLYTGVSTSGAYSMGITKGTTNTSVRTQPQFYIPVTAAAGRRWYIGARIGATSSVGTQQLVAQWFNASKTLLSSTTVASEAATSTWRTLEGQVTVPANARYLAVTVTHAGTNNTTAFYDEIFAREVVVAAQIGDGEISTPKLAANAVTADKIAANAITADMLITNNALIGALQATDLSTINLRSVNIEGGTIAIAQSEQAQFVEPFSGTTLPTGWTIYNGIGNPDNNPPTVVTSGGPAGGSGSRLRHQTKPLTETYQWRATFVQIPVQSLDFEFRMKFAVQGVFDNSLLRSVKWGVSFRNNDDMVYPPYEVAALDGFRIEAASGTALGYEGSGQLGSDRSMPTYGLSQWCWLAVRAVGNQVQWAVWADGQPEPDDQNWTVAQTSTAPKPGTIVLFFEEASWGSPQSIIDQTRFIDTVELNSIATGFKVDADGATSIQRLQVRDFQIGGDPTDPAITPLLYADHENAQLIIPSIWNPQLETAVKGTEHQAYGTYRRYLSADVQGGSWATRTLAGDASEANAPVIYNAPNHVVQVSGRYLMAAATKWGATTASQRAFRVQVNRGGNINYVLTGETGGSFAGGVTAASTRLVTLYAGDILLFQTLSTPATTILQGVDVMYTYLELQLISAF